jgi:glycosyltransferase involved in cell wall biosynthesis
VIVGGKHDLEPGYKSQLKRQIKSGNLQDRVLLAGFQSNIPLWMQAMDVFVHASDHEPFGIVILEAMALGKPIVAGSQGGATEILLEGETGLLAPYENERKLAGQVLQYLNAPERAQEMGRAARERARDFGPKAYAERFTQAVSEILGERTRAIEMHS